MKTYREHIEEKFMDPVRGGLLHARLRGTTANDKSDGDAFRKYKPIGWGVFKHHDGKRSDGSLDVHAYMNDRLKKSPGKSLSGQKNYEHYCDWCSKQDSPKEPMKQAEFDNHFNDHLRHNGIEKARVSGRPRAIGIEPK